MFDAYGAPQYGLSDVKVAAYNATDDYGAAVDVMSAQALSTQPRVISAELVGDDEITSAASRVVAAQITMRWGGVSIAALEVMTGSNATSSVSSPNEVTTFRLEGGQRMPWFGIAGVALAEEGQGDFVVFNPKCKIMGDFTIVQLEYGTFAIPEMTVMAIGDATYGITNLIPRETAAAITIPPANIDTIA